MRPLLLLFVCWFFSTPAFAQTINNQIQAGKVNPDVDKYLKMETQVRQGLPELLSDLREMGREVKSGEWEDAQSKLTELRSDLDQGMKALSKEPPYQEIQNTFLKIQVALDKAEKAVQRRDKNAANAQLIQAYRYAKVLAESPALKLSTAMAMVNAASKQVHSGNFSLGGNFLNRALNILSQIQDNPNVDMRDINNLKNDIVVVHQQVILGKLADEKPVKTIYDKMSIANTNTLYQYYDMWSRTDMAWDQY